MPQRRSDMPLLPELEKVLVGSCHYKHAAPDGAIRRGGGYEILRLGAWNRRQQRIQRGRLTTWRASRAKGKAEKPGKAAQSHLQATRKPSAWEGIATLKPPLCDPHATFMRPASHPKATSLAKD